jgi:hypothetical protein
VFLAEDSSGVRHLEKAGARQLIDGTLDREAARERKRQRILEGLLRGREERAVC